ncbi:MAG: hypothetical protein HYV60_10725 [Planctomycetia bacterium]|nr:hypothetical protein [Planctomycetia bacterium]
MTYQAARFLSPAHKVRQFLERSWDLWKSKHQELKMQLKLAFNQVRAVETSRRQWRDRALAAEAQLRLSKAEKNIADSAAS